MSKFAKKLAHSENEAREGVALMRLFQFEDSLGDSPRDRLMKAVLNNKTLRVKLFNRMLEHEDLSLDDRVKV